MLHDDLVHKSQHKWSVERVEERARKGECAWMTYIWLDFECMPMWNDVETSIVSDQRDIRNKLIGKLKSMFN